MCHRYSHAQASGSESGDDDFSDNEVNGFADPMTEAEQYDSPDFRSGSGIFPTDSERSPDKREIVTADRLRGAQLSAPRSPGPPSARTGTLANMDPFSASQNAPAPPAPSVRQASR